LIEDDSTQQRHRHHKTTYTRRVALAANDIYSNEANLIEEVHRIRVALFDDELQEGAVCVDIYRLFVLCLRREGV
jgi:hypothetical protein